jgi:hypothetical protein
MIAGRQSNAGYNLRCSEETKQRGVEGSKEGTHCLQTCLCLCFEPCRLATPPPRSTHTAVPLIV